MRILSILTYYHPHWTGLTAYARRIAEGLVARGHEVTVLTTQHDPALPLEDAYHGVRIVRVPTFVRISRGVVAPQFPLIAQRLIREHDLVQIHTPLMESLLVAGLCRAFSKPLLITHHGDLVMPAGFTNQLIERTVVGMMTTAERLAARISIHSRDYAENSDFLWPFASKLAYIYPPVDIPAPQPEAVAAWRRELGFENKKLIGFAGRWVEEKGFDYLLAAIPQLLAADPNIHLLYAGERQVVYEHFYEQCRPLVEAHADHITFLGLLRDPQQLANFYALCDVFALPSRTDCFPSVQIEAMLSGTPMATANIPGAREAVQVTGMGRLVEARNPAALAEGLLDVAQNGAAYTKSRTEIEAIFNMQRTIDQYEALMAEMTRQPISRTNVSVPAEPQQPNVPVIRDRYQRLPWHSLTAQDHACLDDILRNEADMAYRRRARVLLDYLELEDGERVLDCGCGMGFYLMALGQLRRLRLIGLDGDRERLHWAQREHVPAGLLNTDILKLPFPDASFDKVLMSEVLEHIDDDRGALREIFRVLKPGGILSLSVPHANYPFWWDPINSVWTGIGGEPIRSGPIAGLWSNHERLYRPVELTARMQAAGFDLEIVEEITHYSFPFIHFLVYGIGKPLIEHNLLPTTLRKSADRFAGRENSGSLLNPINLGLAVFRQIDRLNDRPQINEQATFVNILVKARKPAH